MSIAISKKALAAIIDEVNEGENVTLTAGGNSVTILGRNHSDERVEDELKSLREEMQIQIDAKEKAIADRDATIAIHENMGLIARIKFLFNVRLF